MKISALAKKIESLREKARRLDVAASVATFERAGQVISDTDIVPASREMLSFYKPLLELVDWKAQAAGHPTQSAAFELTGKLVMAHALHQTLTRTSQKEATLAGVDLPTFTTQKLLVILAAYPKMWALQLFGAIPLNGPTGRMFFKDFYYGEAHLGSTPTIAVGDRTDETAKFNADYYSVVETEAANTISFKYSHLDVSASNYRVAGEWSDELEDDAANVFGDNAEATHLGHMAQEMGRVVDRALISAAVNAILSANANTFDAAPSSGPTYASLTPDQQAAYDQRLWTHGFGDTIEKIRVTCKYGDDSTPSWALIGTDIARLMRRIKGFKPVDVAPDQIRPMSGARRDFGMLTDENLRLIVDPMLTSTVAILGRRPTNRGDRGIYFLPYVALQQTRDSYDPKAGVLTKAMRTRFAIAKPDTSTNARSEQLAYPYGKLTVSNAS